MNMLATIVPKSDQLNSDDLIGQDRTITVSRVTMDTSSEQPVSLYFEGDNGKPYKPGKSMRRVLVNAWGADASAYAGRSLTIYRDPDVKFGGMDVGGIRISHMSHIQKQLVMALTTTRGTKKPFVVKPLKMEAPLPPKEDKAAAVVRDLKARADDAETLDALAALKGDDTVKQQVAWLHDKRPALATEVDAAFAAAGVRLIDADGPMLDAPPDDDDEAPF